MSRKEEWLRWYECDSQEDSSEFEKRKNLAQYKEQKYKLNKAS